jgi:formate hydrogenlyase subunit 3/multisubunit Na+/H+ antiporter MnhD subunit
MVPILVLLLGSASLLSGLQPRFRFVGLLGVFTAALAFLTLLVLGVRPLPVSNIVSNWGPLDLFARPLAFRIDGLAWLMSLAVSVTTLAVFLTGLARGGGRRLAPRGASLLITAAALSAIFSADLVTLAVSWALLDMLYFLALIGLAGSDERQAVLSLAFNGAATLLVVAAAIRGTATGGGLVFGETAFGPRTTLLLVLAAVFRLGLFPLHLALPVEANVRQGLGAVLRLAPAAVALALLARIISAEGALPLRPWLTVAGVAGLWVGASQWWLSPDPKQGLPFFVVSQSSVALLTGLWGGPVALAGLVAQSLALVLGGAVLFLYKGQDEQSPWHAALPGVAAAAVIGVPFLTGFTGQWILFTGLTAAGNYLVLLLVVVGQALLGAGLLRMCFWPAEAPLSADSASPLMTGAYLAGLGLPLVFLLLAGLSPQGLSNFLGVEGMAGLGGLFSPVGLFALGLILLAAVGGLGVWRFETELRARTDPAWGVLTAATRLDWLYLAVWNLYRGLSAVLRTAAEILDGDGAVLWAVLIALVAWLTYTGRVR